MELHCSACSEELVLRSLFEDQSCIALALGCIALILGSCIALILRSCIALALSCIALILRSCIALILGSCIALILRSCIALALGSSIALALSCIALILRSCIALILRSCIALILGSCIALILRSCIALILRSCIALTLGSSIALALSCIALIPCALRCDGDLRVDHDQAECTADEGQCSPCPREHDKAATNGRVRPKAGLWRFHDLGRRLLVSNPVPSHERAWYTLFTHALDFYTFP